MDNDTIVGMLTSSEEDFNIGKEIIRNNLELKLFTPEQMVDILDEVWWKMVTRKEVERFQELNIIVTNYLMAIGRFKQSD